MLQQFDLSQGPLGQNFLAEDIGDLLDGDALAGGIVRRSTISSAAPVIFRACSPNNAVCALPQFFRHGVAIVHDKVLIEHLEHLAT